MHILTTSTLSQDINIKPRRTSIIGNTVLQLINKSSRQTVDYTVTNTFDSSKNVSTITGTFTDLTAETYYTIVIKDDVSEIYRGMAYVTNQIDYPKYEVGKGDYIVEQTFDNQFVFLDSSESGGGGGVVSLCYDTSVMAAKTSAFQVCSLYCVTVDGTTYDDWYVPAKGEVDAFLADFPKITNNQLEGYGYDRIPEGVVNQNPFSVDFKNIWTSTELSQSSSYMWRMPLYGNNIVSEQKNTPEIQADLPFVVRPFRFEPNTDSSIITGDKFAGGVVAAIYNRDGVDGKLIVSPTQPSTGHLFWSDLGQTLTGVNGETNGETNSNAILALGG